jgi:hypothetical protein
MKKRRRMMARKVMTMMKAMSMSTVVILGASESKPTDSVAFS